MEEYIIEVRDKFTPNWKETKKVPASQTTATVDGLVDGNQYEFRVKGEILVLISLLDPLHFSCQQSWTRTGNIEIV